MGEGRGRTHVAGSAAAVGNVSVVGGGMSDHFWR
jgi:hypothetical protein